MKAIDPVQALREVNGASDSMLEQAQVAARSYDINSESGLPNAGQDSQYSHGGGYSALVSPGGPRDIDYFPDEIVELGGTRSAVDPTPASFAGPGGPVVPVPEDGFGAQGSWENILNRR